MTVFEAGFSIRALCQLDNAGIQTFAQLVDRRPVDLLRLPHFGRKQLAEVAAVLADLGLSLREE